MGKPQPQSPSTHPTPDENNGSQHNTPARQSKPKTKAKTPAASFTLIFILLLPSLILVAYSFYEQIRPKDTSDNAMVDFVKKKYIAQSQQAFDSFDRVIQPLQTNSTFKNAVLTQSQNYIDLQVNKLLRDNPAISAIRTIPLHSIESPNQVGAQMSFSEYDLMRQIEKGDIGRLELTQENDNAWIKYAKPIMKDTAIIGTLLITVNKSFFDEHFSELSPQLGQIELIQLLQNENTPWLSTGVNTHAPSDSKTVSWTQLFSFDSNILEKWLTQKMSPTTEHHSEILTRIEAYHHHWKLIYTPPVAEINIDYREIVRAIVAGLILSLLLLFTQIFNNASWKRASNRNLRILMSKVLSRSDRFSKESYSLAGFADIERDLKRNMYAFTHKSASRTRHKRAAK